jgi:predicted nucleic acid-binding protein
MVLKLKVFIDSDVVVSSLLSTTGAASFLIQKSNDLTLFVSDISQKELEIVIDRLQIRHSELLSLLEKNFNIISLQYSPHEARDKYCHYVFDKNDAHIVAGAKEAKVRFLITYNIKDFNIEKIKQDFNILVMTPGKFLQYLRSIH